MTSRGWRNCAQTAVIVALLGNLAMQWHIARVYRDLTTQQRQTRHELDTALKRYPPFCHDGMSLQPGDACLILFTLPQEPPTPATRGLKH